MLCAAHREFAQSTKAEWSLSHWKWQQQLTLTASQSISNVGSTRYPSKTIDKNYEQSIKYKKKIKKNKTNKRLDSILHDKNIISDNKYIYKIHLNPKSISQNITIRI